MKKDLFYYTIILAFGLYNAYLLITDKITFYIHPRFIWLSTLMTIIAIVISATGIYLTIDNLKQNNSKPKIIKLLKNASFTEFILILVLMFGFLLAPSSLSSVTASQRISNFNNINLVSNNTQEAQVEEDYKNSVADVDTDVVLGATPDAEKKLSDWIYFFTIEDKVVFRDRPVNVTGFILDREDLPDGYFYVSRFIVTCCTVDASPVGALVKYDWEGEFESDDWVEIEGSFIVDSEIDKNEPVIAPGNIKEIEEPEYPYLF